MHQIAIFSYELENVKQLNFRLQKLESDNIEFEKSVLIYIKVYRKINNKSLIFCLSSSGKPWYEDLLDDGLKSTLTVCPSEYHVNPETDKLRIKISVDWSKVSRISNFVVLSFSVITDDLTDETRYVRGSPSQNTVSSL
jgi:hypothetical protein